MHRFKYKKNSVRTRYKGSIVSMYDEKRRKREKWKLEMEAIKMIADKLPSGSTIIDIPAGTGRFFPLLAGNSNTVYGMDISRDMLLSVKEKYPGNPINMIHGDAVNIPLKDNSVDYVVCIRLLNWVMPGTMKTILNEFRRVTRKGIIVGFRTQKPMDFPDFIRFGTQCLLPTSTRLKRWLKKIRFFTLKAKGKLTHEIRRITGKQEAQSVKDKRNFFMQTFYDREAMSRLFSEIGMEVTEEIYIDTLYSFSKWLSRPYSIYYLHFKA